LKKKELGAVFALLLAASLARAGEPAPTPKAPAAASTFLGFSESDRKAAQDALAWLGLYNGTDDGVPAKRTIEALKAYQQSVGAPTDGIMSDRLLSALKTGAAKAKAAVGFAVIDDPATGVRIGAPLKLLERRVSAAGGSAFLSRDGAVGLYSKAVKGDLMTLYKTMTIDAGGRKATYKALKPGVFFVIAGEDGDNKFYRRYAANDDLLRGFAFLYPKARAKALDPVAVAIANSFDPFPAVPLPPTQSPAPTPRPPKLTATALIVAPGVAVTALDAASCKAPTIAGKPVRFLAPQGALARLGGDFGAGATAPPIGPGGGDIVALTFAGAPPILEAAAVRAVGPAQVIGASGAPLFDRQGRLVGFVPAMAAAPSRAGVALATPRPLIGADALGPPTPDAGASLTAAEIAKLRRDALVGIFCGA
jgi:peptidoglycan hydrolase-like protein with peptidoglycan-binding domain